MATDLRNDIRNDVRAPPETSVTALVTGILNDAQKLLSQQVDLFKAEIRSDLIRSRDAAIWLLVGLGTAAVGAGLLFLMLVHLLQWVTEWPLWACHGVIGGGLAV